MSSSSSAAAPGCNDGNVDQGELCLTLGDAVGTMPDGYGIAAGDFDGDSKVDLVATSLNGSGLQFFAGMGNGTFAAPVAGDTGSGGSSHVAAGDLNGDNKLDLVVAGSVNSDGSILILLGKGDGTFEAAVPHPSATGFFVTLVDLNMDGKLDVVTSNTLAHSITIALGDGTGGIGTPVDTDLGGNSELDANAVAAADLNADQVPDLVVVNSRASTLQILLGVGDGTVVLQPTAVTAGDNPEAVAIGDFNGDGKLDLTYPNTSGGDVGINTGVGDGTFNASTVTEHISYMLRPFGAADMDKDGKLDVVLVADAKLNVLLGKGDATFKATQPYDNMPGGVNLVVTDFNGDGVPDVATMDYNDPSSKIRLLLSNP